MPYMLLSLLLLGNLQVFAGFTIGAYNIRNFDYDTRYRIRTNKTELASILKNLQVDVLSVEEINNTAEFETYIPSKLSGYKTALTDCGGAHGQRLGFIYNSATVDLLSFHEDLSISDPGQVGGCDTGSRPLAIGIFQIKSTRQKFIGMTAHLKSGSDPEAMQKRAKQFEILKKIIQDLTETHGIRDYYVGGDLNTTQYYNRGVDYTRLNQLTQFLGIKDVTEHLGCSAYWWGGTDDGKEDPSLLDHLLVSPGLLKTTAKAEVHGHCKKVNCAQATPAQLGISYESVSDHCPITAVIQ
jgi:endonuclease/exonuclease/phosphatase family metal-dependent hydrolase